MPLNPESKRYMQLSVMRNRITAVCGDHDHSTQNFAACYTRARKIAGALMGVDPNCDDGWAYATEILWLEYFPNEPKPEI